MTRVALILLLLKNTAKPESCTAPNKTCEFEFPDLNMYMKCTRNDKFTVLLFSRDPTQLIHMRNKSFYDDWVHLFVFVGNSTFLAVFAHLSCLLDFKVQSKSLPYFTIKYIIMRGNFFQSIMREW